MSYYQPVQINKDLQLSFHLKWLNDIITDNQSETIEQQRKETELLKKFLLEIKDFMQYAKYKNWVAKIEEVLKTGIV